MSVIVPILNGKNVSRDFGFQGMQSAILSSGIWRGERNECEVTVGQVETGVCFVPVRRESVIPAEEFTIPVSITTSTAVDTVTDGYIIVKLDDTKVDLGITNSANGDNIATIENVAVLPARNYLVLAEIIASVVTLQADRFAKINNGLVNVAEYYGIDTSAVVNVVEASIYGIDEYQDGAVYKIKIANTNTGAMTIDVNSLGAKPFNKMYDVPLVSGDMKAGQIVLAVYNETDDWFQLTTTPAILLGLTKATDADMDAGTNDDRYVTPAKVQYAFDAGGAGIDGQVMTKDSASPTGRAWATQGYEVIADQTSASINVSIPTGYRMLKAILTIVKNGIASTAAQLTFNGDSGANYAYRKSQNFGADTTATAQNGITLLVPNNDGGLHTFEIRNHSLTRKSFMIETCTAGDSSIAPNAETIRGVWDNTANEISSITISDPGANFAATTRLVVLGIK